MIPRQSYLPLLIESIRAHFIDFVSSFNKDDLWLEYDEHALKWHLPAGVLFDALNVNNTLPWSITVRFNNFPSEKIYRCTSENDINWNYMNTVKEVNTKHINSQTVNVFTIWKR
jgi:autophagy-related protein 5